MLRNYFLMAWRTIWKEKFFAGINILGLSVGLASSLLLWVYVEHELSYDRFHRDARSVYRVSLTGKVAGQEILTGNSSMPVAAAMQLSVPGVEEVLRVIPATRGNGMACRYEALSFPEEKVFYADSNFFNFFSFELVAGDPATALLHPNSVVVTESVARKYFGNGPALGKTLVLRNDKKACKVTGVARDVPPHSHLRFRMVISMATVESEYGAEWTSNNLHTYIRKSPATSVASVNSRLADLVSEHVGPLLEQGLGISFDEFRRQGGEYSYAIYPLLDSHLKGLPDDFEPGGDIRYVYIFIAVGVFILLIACVNFMNLATARAARRTKEVGLRKTFGSQRAQLMTQFLAESFVYSLLAMALALVMAALFLPRFNLLAGKELTLQALISPSFFGGVLCLLVFVTLLAGSYPAFYLTSFGVVEVLKGRLRAGTGGRVVRSGLVMFQFFVSTLLIISTLVVYRQVRFLQSKNLGLDPHGIVVVQSTGRLEKNIQTFRDAVQQLPGVVQTSFTNNAFPGVNNITVFRVRGSQPDHLLGQYVADWHHQDVLKLKMKQGRFFARAAGTDSAACVINEAAVRELNLTDPLREELIYTGDDAQRSYRIIGVLDNFNYESLRQGVRPLVILFAPEASRLFVRYQGDPQAVIASIENQWRAMAAGEPFEYGFLDEAFDALFRSETRLRSLFTTLAALTVFIACLGLFALTAYTTGQRTKEIAVRKALGASVPRLTLMLSNELTRLVLFAALPATAAGWWLANWWLTDFEYRASLTPWLFLAGSAAVLLVAWLTVAVQSARAARVDPVKSLRCD